MNLRRVGIVGHFGGHKEFLDGQTIKTKILCSELRKEYGAENIKTVDTYNWRKHPFKLLIQSINLIKQCKNVILIPCTKGILVFVPLFSFLNLFFKRKLHYVLVGAWLFQYFEKYRWLKRLLQKFDSIYVEPSKTKVKLIKIGFQNAYQMPNCKNLTILPKEMCDKTITLPLKFCTFSRVLKEKGIEDAIEAVQHVNETTGAISVSLDIYGQIDNGYEERFADLQKNFPAYIRYGGEIPFDKSTDTIKGYDALLFPTLYYTEGHPGTIIDAFAAGVPVIASRWENFDDMIQDGNTGIGYQFGENSLLKEVLLKLLTEPSVLNKMKIDCLNEAEKYTPASTLTILKSNLK